MSEPCFPRVYITSEYGVGQELKQPVEFAKGPSLRPISPGYLLVVLSALLFAAGGNAVKALFRLGYSPLVLSQLRIWWAFACLFVILLAVRPALLRVKLRELPALTVFGTVTAFERYHRRQAVPTQVWVALAMVLFGAFFAVGAYQPALLRVNLPGVMLGLVAAGFFAFYILRASTLARRLDTWTLLLYGFGAGSLLWAAFDIVSGTHLPTDWRIWAVMALLGLLGTLAAHGLFVLALRTIRPSTAGIVATAEPVFAGLIAFFVLGDRLQPLQVFGAAVIVAGIIIVQAGSNDAAVTVAPIQ